MINKQDHCDSLKAHPKIAKVFCLFFYFTSSITPIYPFRNSFSMGAFSYSSTLKLVESKSLIGEFERLPFMISKDATLGNKLLKIWEYKGKPKVEDF